MMKIKQVFKFLLPIIIIYLFFQFVGQFSITIGSSMENTIHNGDMLFFEKLSTNYDRYQIVIFESTDPKEPYYIKRVIGLPGETVQIIDSSIYINGNIIDDEHKRDLTFDSGIAEEEIKLGDDEYFVLGDNRNNSKDSRLIGPVSESTILGRVLIRLWPFDVLF